MKEKREMYKAMDVENESKKQRQAIDWEWAADVAVKSITFRFQTGISHFHLEFHGANPAMCPSNVLNISMGKCAF